MTKHGKRRRRRRRQETSGSTAGGPTPPPPQAQIRGHFEDQPHFASHFQAAAPPFQPGQPAYVDMSKPATGRVSSGPVPQAPQPFGVLRGQHGLNPMSDVQDQQGTPMAWNAPQPQNAYYIAPNQNMRQPRMPTVNNGQVAGSNLTYMPGMPGNLPFIPGNVTYNGSQPLQFVQNPGGQFMQYQQPRMPFPMQQGAQMNYVPTFGAPASGTYPAYYPQPPMQMTNTSRPSSVGPQGAGPSVPKQPRNRSIIKMTDPNTGEDLTEKLFFSQHNEEDASQQEALAHRNAVTLEFATKVAILAQDRKDRDPEMSPEVQPSAQVQGPEISNVPLQISEPEATAASSVKIAQTPVEESPVINGEPDLEDISQVPSVESPAPCSVPASVTSEIMPQPVQTMATAQDVQTLSPAPGPVTAPVVPTSDIEVPVSEVPEREISPAPEVEKPSTAVELQEKEVIPPVEAAPAEEPSPAVPLQTTTVSAAVAASLIGDNSSGQTADARPAAQASGPQPQRQDGRKGKKNKRDYNKKSKEGSDMDAFYDTQTSQESTDKGPSQESTDKGPEQSAEAAPPKAVSPPVSAPAVVAPSGADDTPVESPQEASPAPEATAPQVQPKAAVLAPAPSPPEVRVEEPPAEEESKPPAENGVSGETEQTEKPRPKQMANGIQLEYKEGQWSPVNPEGKKQYDREFLLKLQANPESRKAPSLPDMPEILIDPRMLKMEDFQKAQALAAGRGVPDFTPGFFKSAPRSGGPGSMSKRNSQQSRRGPGSQGGEQRIIPSLRQEITLHKSENAYKPLFQKDAVDVDAEAKETLQVLRNFKSILNKLTPEKFEKLANDALQLNINTEDRLTGVADLIFQKAISESKFATQYANLCKEMLKLPRIPKVPNPNESKPTDFLTFRAVLLTKCQKEFETDTIAEGELEKRRKALEIAPEEEKEKLTAELKEATTKARHRSMGNIRFIGELFRLKMLTESIMHDCIFKLLKIRDDDSIECLTKLLETIGKDLDIPKAKHRMDQYFVQFEKMTADVSAIREGAPVSGQRSKESKDKLSTRVKFGVLEILEMRRNNWVRRKIHDQNKPTTLGAIHQKAKEEQQEQQFLNSQPRMDSNPRSGGAKGKGRSSMQGDSDGWNTVPAKPVRQQIDATKMKITKTNVDEITLTLGGGNKFQSWGRGSQGGGSRSQEQEKPTNRYTALNSLNDNDGRRGYGRSPARGDSRGSRMGGDRDRDRDRRDRDKDFRKPVSRSSMEAEKERAVASTRHLLGAGATSNPSSRSASRDNSQSRDFPQQTSAPAGADSVMDDEQLQQRLFTITNELHSNQNIKDAKDSVVALGNVNYARFVAIMIEKMLDKTAKTRRAFGQLLFEMFREKQLSGKAIIEGCKEIFDIAEDLAIDVPRIWQSLAELFAGLLQDHHILPLLQGCMPALLPERRPDLTQKILKATAENTSEEAVQKLWAASGLQFSDFDMDTKSPKFEVQWLSVLPRRSVHDAVCEMFKDPRAKNEAMFKQLEAKFSRQVIDSIQFIRELTCAICRSYITVEPTKDGSGYKLDKEGLKNRIAVLRKYIDNDKERGIQVLVGVTQLLCELEHPRGLVRLLFDLFYDEDLVSEDSFFTWHDRDGPPEEQHGKGIVKMNVKDFFDWLKTGGEDEATS